MAKTAKNAKKLFAEGALKKMSDALRVFEAVQRMGGMEKVRKAMTFYSVSQKFFRSGGRFKKYKKPPVRKKAPAKPAPTKKPAAKKAVPKK